MNQRERDLLVHPMAHALRTLIIGLFMMGMAQVVLPVDLPLFDGVIIVEPYRYLTAPSGAQNSPSSAKVTLQVEGGISPGFAVYTTETPPQAEVLGKGGEFALGAETTSLTVTIDPVSAPAGAASSGIAGNVYRVAVVDQSGAAVPLAAGQTVILALRGPAGTAVDATIARFSDGAWDPVKTAPSGLHDLFLTDAEAFGDYAVLGQVAPSTGGLDPQFLLWALVAAGLIVLVAWRFRGRSNPPGQPNNHSGRPRQRRKR